jgi:hypothetical protein
MYKALCLTDTVQDVPYQYFKAGVEYVIPEDCPVIRHFKRVGAELDTKEAERLAEEGFPDPVTGNKPLKGTRRKGGYAEAF